MGINNFRFLFKYWVSNLYKAVYQKLLLYNLHFFQRKEAVQQLKIGRKRKANRALNPKRSEIFSAKSNCGAASKAEKRERGCWRYSNNSRISPFLMCSLITPSKTGLKEIHQRL